jgi:hypothetical protein
MRASAAESAVVRRAGLSLFLPLSHSACRPFPHPYLSTMERVLVDKIVETDYGQFDLVWSEDGGLTGTLIASSPARSTALSSPATSTAFT